MINSAPFSFLYKSTIASTIVFAFISLSTHCLAAGPYTTEGKFSVGSDGSANYSIPIVVPPGTAGMQPQLALNYNSNGGNGIVGMGWGIDGLSQISRCGTTLEQDGVINGVTYTNTDRFCIDGQRLIATSDSYNTSTKQYSTTSAYGANGTEYRTESANFAKIISYGQAGNGPAYFKVWTKSGQIIEYGNTADSAIEAQGKPTIRTWGVNKISDTKGNYITVSYTEDNANGEAYVSRIDYTGNANSTPALAPYANIQFIYEARPDTTIAYQAGSVLKTTKRLTNIQTYTGSTLVKNYKLSFLLNIPSNASQLATIQECDSSGMCLIPKSFMFNLNSGWSPVPSSAWPSSSSAWCDPAHQGPSADFNGDGKLDLICNSDDGRHIFAFSKGDGSFVSSSWWPASGAWCDPEHLHYGDFNGDGKTDMICNASSTYDKNKSGDHVNQHIVAFSNGDGTFSSNGWWATAWCDFVHLSFGDFNGDGRTDLFCSGGDGLHSVAFSKGDGTFAPSGVLWPSYGPWCDPEHLHYGDFNGDGKTDMICNASTTYDKNRGTDHVNQHIVAFSNGDGTFSSNGWWATAWCDFVHLSFGDFNGDGKTDLFCSGGDGLHSVAFSKGDGAFAPSGILWPSYGPWCDPEHLATLDINGDNKLDMVCNSDDGKHIVAFSVGDGTFTSPGWWPEAWCDPKHLNYGDFDGDGSTDMICNAPQGWHAVLLSGSYSSRNKKIFWGDTTTATIDYNPISDNALYVKDDYASGAGYPIQDVQASIYVVSSASVSDGIGGVVTTNYQYGGLKSHLRGRGSLGFRYVKESSPDSGLSVTTFYRQDFPFIGLPSQVEKRRLSDNALLSVVQNTYANSDLATNTIISKFPYLSQSVEQAYELDGSLVSTTTTTNQYDGYGNVTSVKVDDGLGNTKTTTSTYKNDVGNWLLGRLIRSTVTSVTP